jgi:hypothetical protein
VHGSIVENYRTGRRFGSPPFDLPIEWAKRAPAPHGEDAEGEIELRQFFELDERELEKQLAGKKG